MFKRIKQAALLLAALFAGQMAAHATDITGVVVHIVDGDTFDIRVPGETIRIRFCGIDTPEQGKGGFAEASSALRGLIDKRQVRCVRIGEGTPCDGRSEKTNRKRIIAQCFLGNRDIATEMVRSGRACDYPRFSGGYYRRVGGPNVCVRR